MAIEIREVTSAREYRQFLRFPLEIHDENSPWVPPMWMDERNLYKQHKNPALENADTRLLLAFRGGKPVARLMLVSDTMWDAFFRVREGQWGAFEAQNDPEAVAALFSEATQWFAGLGCTRMVGPINPVTDYWGILVEGFDDPPVFLTPWNPPYYQELLEGAGFTVHKELYAYEIDAREGYSIGERYADFSDKLLARYPGLTLRPLDPRHIVRDALIIWKVSNRSITGNWGFLPVTRKTVIDMVKRLKLIADPDAMWFAEFLGKPVAIMMGYPDLNLILKKTRGRLFPFGWIPLLTQTKSLKRYRLFGLAVDPVWQGKGIDALMYVALARALSPKKIRLEANWILAENVKMNTALVKLGMRLNKRYYLYGKDLSPATPTRASRPPTP